MSGHSKWSSIKHKKGAADKKRGAIFTRITRDIILAARNGGDPSMNFQLRVVIDKAKKANMPKDNIERAVKKGTGEDKEGATFESMQYEGYGPAQTAVIVDVLTDNKNRSTAEIKHLFSKHGGNMAGSGSVAWQFVHVSAVHINKEEKEKITSRDDLELACIDAGANDILDEDGGLVVYADPSSYQKMVEAVESQGVGIEDSGLEWLAKEKMKVSEEDKGKVESFFEVLDEQDDVQAWYTNAE